MKNYTITVNGTAYDVTVEEGGAGSAPVRAAAPKAAPAAAPKAAAGAAQPPTTALQTPAWAASAPLPPAAGRSPKSTPLLSLPAPRES